MTNGNSRMSGGDGLIRKFEVKRLTKSSRGIDHSECEYFVLDPVHDPIARKLLAEYASIANEVGETALSRDMYQWLSDIQADQLAEQYRKENGIK